MRLIVPLLAALLLAACEPAMPRTGARTPPLDAALLDQEIGVIAQRAQPARIEVAVQNLEGGEMWAWNGDKAFPMQSVFKAPLAAAVLAEVDAGRLSLDEVITLGEAEISPAHSRIADAWPERATYTVRELLVWTVGDSDNTAADVLMRRIGGPGAVTAWLRSKGIKEIRIDRYERELQPETHGMESFRIAWKGWPAFEAAMYAVPEATRRAATARYLADPRDTATASGALTFLRKLSAGELLTPRGTALLLKLMTDTTSGETRLKAGLPPGARLAHKTGTAATDLGMTPVVNDIGLVTLKDGRQYAVAVFMIETTADEAAQDAIIADIMRVIARAAG
ncbi:MAG: class A beta-lactamase [Caulobacter sp.]